jgi:squalene cyclase
MLEAGYGDDSRVRAAVEWVVAHQKSDGGWHCFLAPAVGRGTLDCWEGLSALAAIPESRRSTEVQKAIRRGAEFYLRRHLLDEGRPPYAPWRRFHFPAHYYYDALVGLDLLTSLGFGADPRLNRALALLGSKRRPDGTWAIDRQHPDLGRGAGYRLRPAARPLVLERVDRPSRWLTLTALRVLRRVASARSTLSA